MGRKMAPKRKFKKQKSGSSDSESGCHEEISFAKREKVVQPLPSYANQWDETDLDKTGVYYERVCRRDFNRVLDECPSVCHRLPLETLEIIKLLSNSLEFDFELGNTGKFEQVDEQGMNCLRLAQEKLETLSFSIYEEEFGTMSPRDDYCNTCDSSRGHTRSLPMAGNSSACSERNEVGSSKSERQELSKSLEETDGSKERIECLKRYEMKIQCIYNAKKFLKIIFKHIENMSTPSQFPVREEIFTQTISHFSSMCNLERQPGLYKRFIIINDTLVIAIPHVLTYTGHTEATSTTVAVVEVKFPQKTMDDKIQHYNTIRSSDSNCTRDETSMEDFNIHNLIGRDVLGQHGAELLVERNRSAKGSHIFGMIVLGFQVVLTSLHITEADLYTMKTEGDISESPRGINYSKPFNILSSSDRRQLYEILFRLAEKC